ncbi:MAG: pirin family protein [Candidatus Marinimicrobia bacterium]|nr:pirin family protein [Candidatus Neomarinimicrobiota bacterium]
MNLTTINQQKIKARETTDGAGAKISRVFPGHSLRHIDPFVLLDEFFVSAEASFPEHPHRGFEAITYMLEGAFRHKDNLGNDSVVAAGGAQRFSAGKEIRHAELPGTENMNHGLQLWINLPGKLKNMEPTYQQVEPEDIPKKEENGVYIRSIVCENSPLTLHTKVEYIDVEMDQGAWFEKHIPAEWNTIIYVIDNNLIFDDLTLTPGEAIIGEFKNSLKVQAPERSRFVLITGQPHNEPIRQRGSIVE